MSQAFSPGPSPFGADLRSAMIADADDVARLLTELGYPCEIDEAAERIDAIAAKEKASEAEAAELAKVAEENAKERARLEKAQKEAEAEAIKATGFYSENDPQAIPKGKGANA